MSISNAGVGSIQCGEFRKSHNLNELAVDSIYTSAYDHDSTEDEYLLHILAASSNFVETSPARQIYAEFLRQHRRVIRSVATAAFTLGLLSLMATILWFTIIHPKPLKLQVHSVALEKFMLHFSFPSLSPKVDAMLKFNISLANPNIGSFWYENSTAYLYYHGDQFGAAPFPGGLVPAKGKKTVVGNTDIFADEIMKNAHLMSDMREDIFPVTLFTSISGRIHVFDLFYARVNATANCSISFAVSTQNMKKFSCDYHSKK